MTKTFTEIRIYQILLKLQKCYSWLGNVHCIKRARKNIRLHQGFGLHTKECSKVLTLSTVYFIVKSIKDDKIQQYVYKALRNKKKSAYFCIKNSKHYIKKLVSNTVNNT